VVGSVGLDPTTNRL